MKTFGCYCSVISALMLTTNLCAAETKIDLSARNNLHLSIYNSGFAFVSDSRTANLDKGLHQIAFEGVSSELMPETAMIQGEGLSVLEQNYNYNLITPQNILENSVGKKVKTALYNEKTGEVQYDEAVILEASHGNPVLEFDYGIETSFPGRIIYSEIPAGLRQEPTLVIDAKVQKSGRQNVELDYISNGLNWKTDYVAEVKSDKKLKLKSLVSLSNESGIDYKDATVQLISGNVQRTAPQAPRVYMARAVKAMANDAVMMESAASGISQESFADYYLYTLPQKTSLLNKQTKQVSLMDKDNVEYTKEYQLESPLYLSYASRGLNQYERQHPSITYKLENKKELGLGEALPNGTVRFFEEDSKGNMQFIGEAFLPMFPINEKAELKIGTAFDITISGKVTDSKVLSKDKQIIKVTQTFNNAKDEEVEVLYRQNFAGNTGWTISSENIKGKKKNNTTQEWLITIPAQQSMELSYEATLNNLNPQNN